LVAGFPLAVETVSLREGPLPPEEDIVPTLFHFVSVKEAFSLERVRQVVRD